MPTASIRRPRTRAKPVAHARLDVVEAVEDFARTLLAHPANDRLREHVCNGETTAADVFDAAQRAVLEHVLRREAVRRGLADAIGDQHWPSGGLIQQHSLLAECVLDEESLRAVIHTLEGPGDSGDSTLGISAMYERLLGMRASMRIDAVDPKDQFALTPIRGSRRRSTGSFYTPPALVRHLLEVTLQQTIDDAMRGLKNEQAIAAILHLRVCDPSCGTGHFLIDAARMLAERVAALGNGTMQARKAALREVIARCIHGVDLNPLAVELCRGLLWLEAGDRTLDWSSLNNRIRCGHALLNAPLERVRAADARTARVKADAWCDRLARSATAARSLSSNCFHWHLEYPEVFDHAAPGFDVVVGNPPFLNQLETGTAIERGQAAIMRERSGGAVRGYADIASAFLLLAVEITRRGGRTALVQPQSLLAARDADDVRKAVLKHASLRSMWIANEHMFEAHVFTCAPMLQRGGDPVANLTRFNGATFARLADVDIDMRTLAAEDSWAMLVADASGIPQVKVSSIRSVGDAAIATADFRDQYYGLDGCLIEDAALTPAQRRDIDAYPPLLTTGLIDLAQHHWASRPTRLLKRRWLSPRVDRARLERDPDMVAWSRARLVPKILLATQTRVMEVFVDEAGSFVPSVPLISVTVADVSDIWRIAAALASPVCGAIALRRFGGTAMTADALKVSAKQVMQLPLPEATPAWDAAADALRAASDERCDASTRRDALHRMAERTLQAYAVPPEQRAELLAWWVNRSQPRGTGRRHA